MHRTDAVRFEFFRTKCIHGIQGDPLEPLRLDDRPRKTLRDPQIHVGHRHSTVQSIDALLYLVQWNGWNYGTATIPHIYRNKLNPTYPALGSRRLADESRLNLLITLCTSYRRA